MIKIRKNRKFWMRLMLVSFSGQRILRQEKSGIGRINRYDPFFFFSQPQ